MQEGNRPGTEKRGISLFFGNGAAAALSISLGRKDTKSIHRCIGTSILCSILSGVAIILISYLPGDHLLRLRGRRNNTLHLKLYFSHPKFVTVSSPRRSRAPAYSNVLAAPPHERVTQAIT